MHNVILAANLFSNQANDTKRKDKTFSPQCLLGSGEVRCNVSAVPLGLLGSAVFVGFLISSFEFIRY